MVWLQFLTEDDLETMFEPSIILTAVDEGQYGEARELLETEYEEDHT